MLVTVRVKPGSRTASVREEGETLIIAVREPAREGRANEAVRRAVAGWFKVAPSRVKLVRGEAAWLKTFAIE